MWKISDQKHLIPFFIQVILFFFIYVPNVVNSTGGFPKGFLNDITESDIIRARLSSRWKWEVWDVVPGTHVFRLYIFNVTNPTEVEKGSKPVLAEIGPYAYTEHRIKFNVCVNLDLTVNYERNFTYTFDPNNSNGTESDLVNILNVPFVIFSTIASRRGNIGKEAIQKLIVSGETLIKRQVKVGDVLFNGIDVNKYKPYTTGILGNENSLLLEEFDSGTYSIFKMKRGAHEGTFTVQSGLKNPSNTGQILKFDNKPNVNYWYGSTCNMINGTDGSVFQPFIDKDTILQIYDIDFCRSIDFKFEKETTFQSVTVYRFAFDKNVLVDPKINLNNECFCKNSADIFGNSNNNDNGCLKTGVLDVSSCKEGAPFVISLPHFFDASPEYGQSIIGLYPNPKLHNIHIDVQPRIGVVIEYKRRLQWNIRIQPLPNIDYFSNFQTLLFPVLWNDDTFELDVDKADLLVSELANLNGYGSAPILKTSFHVVIIICGFLLLFNIQMDYLNI